MVAQLTFLGAARAIGEELRTSAEWRDGVCTWRERSETLDGDLYAGTAGVALFLAGLARATDDDDTRRTALGGIEHGLATVAHRARPQPGFHAGDLGILWAAAEVGRLLDVPHLGDRAHVLGGDVADRLAAERDGRHDVLSGRAGTALALVALAERDELTRVGEALLVGREPALVGCVWPEPEEPRGTVGLAHGAAGIAWALLELAHATGETAFRDAALDGLAYERAWFDAGACTWRDPTSGAATGASWCRGSTGEALARLRALALTPDDQLAAETGTALASVHGHVAAVLARRGPPSTWEGANLSVCHGVMGTADALLEASAALRVPEHLAAAEALAEHAVETADELGAWPCGTLDGSPSPGLMLGLAGIGSVLLRVETPDALPGPGLLAYSTSAAKGSPGSSG